MIDPFTVHWLETSFNNSKVINFLIPRHDIYQSSIPPEGLASKKNDMIRTLAAEKLSNVCAPESIEAYLQAAEVPAHGIIGQERAQKALKLGLGMKAEGFNVFVSGIQGTGKLTAVKEFLETLASMEPAPPDWCYVNNFKILLFLNFYADF